MKHFLLTVTVDSCPAPNQRSFHPETVALQAQDSEEAQKRFRALTGWSRRIDGVQETDEEGAAKVNESRRYSRLVVPDVFWTKPRSLR